MLRLAARHHRVRGDIPRGSHQVGRGKCRQVPIGGFVGMAQEGFDTLDRRRDDRKTVCPFIRLEVGVHLFECAREHDLARIPVATAPLRPVAGIGPGEPFDDFFEQGGPDFLLDHVGRICPQRARVLGKAQSIDAARLCAELAQCRKARRGDHHRRDSKLLDRNGRPHRSR